ncbi:nucleotidyl transferase AbiEii/AbiGii toxin family protein [Bavariicoccus seileri]|uniref:nucleotidyl transferase AbiEii/AbiGii toxin family protein n=1 Tax=Bavariicoccus seileri TaxID=549685 RepID=UPI0003B527D6|nr:nucleotidyl transferase AbiEii/AbiGii toxin family protein [Bavariicoccus seileri]
MTTIIQQMLDKYETKSLLDKKNALKEIMQEMVLCGLSRAGFFKSAAFYGGTALRIFYGLDRFSEDLDFSLTTGDKSFDITSYFPILEKEINAFGINVELSEKVKTKDSTIQSAFLKGNTKQHLLLFFANQPENGIHPDEKIKIKFEVDINPPMFANFEHKFRLLPNPYEVKLYDGPSLFAGKIHAVLCRSWKNRVKGRDLYDYVFYLSKAMPVNLKHLQARLIQSGDLDPQKEFTMEILKNYLFERFDKIDYAQAKQDVVPFIRHTSDLELWQSDFFKQITETLHTESN